MNIGRKISSKISAGFAKIRALSGRRKPFASKPASVQPSSLIVGHRGIAAGSLKARQKLQEEGKQPYTAEEIAKWQNLSGDEVQEFVEHEQILFVNSSNVVSAVYFPKEGKMLVEYKKGKYLYSGVTKAEATQFAQAQSKGAWVWSNLRVRGSRTAHLKPFTKLGK